MMFTNTVKVWKDLRETADATLKYQCRTAEPRQDGRVHGQPGFLIVHCIMVLFPSALLVFFSDDTVC